MSVVQTLYRLYLLERKNTNALFIETQRPSLNIKKDKKIFALFRKWPKKKYNLLIRKYVFTDEKFYIFYNVQTETLCFYKLHFSMYTA